MATRVKLRAADAANVSPPRRNRFLLFANLPSGRREPLHQPLHPGHEGHPTVLVQNVFQPAEIGTSTDPHAPGRFPNRETAGQVSGLAAGLHALWGPDGPAEPAPEAGRHKPGLLWSSAALQPPRENAGDRTEPKPAWLREILPNCRHIAALPRLPDQTAADWHKPLPGNPAP